VALSAPPTRSLARAPPPPLGCHPGGGGWAPTGDTLTTYTSFPDVMRRSALHVSMDKISVHLNVRTYRRFRKPLITGVSISGADAAALRDALNRMVCDMEGEP